MLRIVSIIVVNSDDTLASSAHFTTTKGAGRSGVVERSALSRGAPRFRSESSSCYAAAFAKSEVCARDRLISLSMWYSAGEDERKRLQRVYEPRRFLSVVFIQLAGWKVLVWAGALDVG